MKPPNRSAVLQNQVVRFGFVGAMNTVFSYGVYALGIYLGLTFYVASLLALVFGIVLGFSAQGRFVFRARLKGRMPSYLLMWCLLYLLNIGTIKLLVQFDIGYYIAGLIAAVPVVIFSFVLQKFFVFKG